MANVKISELTAASTPLAGTEVLPIVQSTATVKVSVANLTAGRAITATSLNGLVVSQGGGSLSSNIAVGPSALAANTTGTNNTAVGYFSLTSNTTASNNTALGYQAGYSTVTGAENTFVGYYAGRSSTSGPNTAVGHQALQANTTGINNTAVGYQAVYSNTTGSYNTALGRQTGFSLTTGIGNVLVGTSTGYNLTTGTANTFIGGTNPDTTSACGQFVTTGSKNVIIGGYSGNFGGLDIRTASNYIVLSDGDGNPRMHNGGASAWTIAGTWTTSSATPMNAASVGSNPGTAAVWDGAGNLYKQSSSMRYKENIAEWTVTDAQLDAFVNLSPKLWDYTGKQNGCAGFIAEDIEALGLKNAYNTSPLINYSTEGQPDSNRDFALIALQHKVIQRLEAAVKELKTEFDAYKASHP
jgi:hypothetical protein